MITPLLLLFITGVLSQSLRPYTDKYGHGPKTTHLEMKTIFGNQQQNPHEEFPGYKSDEGGQITESKVSMVRLNNELVPIRTTKLLADPTKAFSIIEPGGFGGCSNGDHRTKVSETSKKVTCLVSGNAGFFNTTTGACLGNLVSKGRIIQNTGIQNANFGVKKDGTIVVGYLSKEYVDNTDNPFINLVAGVMWLVRNGVNYVDQSALYEDMSTQETGNAFISIISARSALGHDAQGRLMLFQIDGKSYQRGINLNQFADYLVSHGVVNAINLDGGGSMTSVMNGTVVNIPSDLCEPEYFCERDVTTIVCFHDPVCNASECSNNNECCSGCNNNDKDLPCPNDCSGNGLCHYGKCICKKSYYGDDCSSQDVPQPDIFNPLCPNLPCPNNCSEHGICHYEKCICDKNWYGDSCQLNYTIEEDTSLLGIFSNQILTVVIVSSGLIGIILFAVFIYLRRKKDPELVYSPNHGEHNQEIEGLTVFSEAEVDSQESKEDEVDLER